MCTMSMSVTLRVAVGETGHNNRDNDYLADGGRHTNRYII